MEITKCVKDAFCVIGKLGSTNDGDGFIQKLWKEANENFDQVAVLAKRDENNAIVGIWGTMSDFSLSFLPWEDGFSRGYYLAGVEVEDTDVVPDGWTKWQIPAFEYLCVKCDQDNIFGKMLIYIKDNNMSLAGAVHEFNNPSENYQAYMYFPIRKLV